MTQSTPLGVITVREAARELGITRRAVLHRIHAGTMRATKIGEGRTSSYIIERAELQRAAAVPESDAS